MVWASVPISSCDRVTLRDPNLYYPLGMTIVLYPVEGFGSTPGCADKVKVELDNGTDMGSLTGYLEGSYYGIPCSSFLVDSL